MEPSAGKPPGVHAGVDCGEMQDGGKKRKAESRESRLLLPTDNNVNKWRRRFNVLSCNPTVRRPPGQGFSNEIGRERRKLRDFKGRGVRCYLNSFTCKTLPPPFLHLEGIGSIKTALRSPSLPAPIGYLKRWAKPRQASERAASQSFLDLKNNRGGGKKKEKNEFNPERTWSCSSSSNRDVS